MIWVRYIGISAMAMLVACSNDSKDVAGSSFETENSIAFHVRHADGSLAAKAKVIINTADYLASGNTTIVREDSTDTYGVLRLDSLHSLAEGDYMVEVRSLDGSEEQKGAVSFEVPKTIPDSGMIVPVNTALPHKFSGKVQTDKSPVWVNIRGLDYLVQVDKQGSFTFESLPEGDFEFVLVTQGSGNDSKPVVIGSSKFCVGCKGSGTSVIVDTTVAPKDTTEKDTLPKDTLKHFMFEDFNMGQNGWYDFASKDAKGTLNIDSTETETRGYTAHFTCVNDSAYNWCLMGHSLGGPVDMSELDSIVFWARGSLNSYLSFSLDIVEDSTLSLKSGKSWTHLELTEEWARYTVTPATMQPAEDENGGNLGWDAVKDNITNISIFGGAGGEFWIDDIEIFGYEKFTPKIVSANN